MLRGRRRTQVARPVEPGGGGSLDLPLIPWDGGPDYWTVAQSGARMTMAEAAGMSSDTYLAKCVFLGKPDSGHPASLAALGINMYMAAEGSSPGFSTANLDAAGILLMTGPDNPYQHDFSDEDWPQITEPGVDFSEIGSNPTMVGWFLADEPDMGYGGWPGDGATNSNPVGFLDAVEGLSATVDAYGDGRFKYMNFGNGVLNTFWSDALAEMVTHCHGFSVDKYPYTSPQVAFEYGRSGDWRAACGVTGTESAQQAAAEAFARTSAAYGWMVKQMRDVYQDPDNLKPHWGFVEVKMPKLNETGAAIITHAQMEGAIFSAIANGATGVAYFQHNGDSNWPATDPNTGAAPTTEVYTLVDGPATYRTAVAAINAKLDALAPVINTQSYEWDFGPARMDTMLKARDGFAYIFASVGPGGTTGSKAFTLPPDLADATTAEVLNESRSVSVTGGAFSDTFANEYTHHVYKVAI